MELFVQTFEAQINDAANKLQGGFKGAWHPVDLPRLPECEQMQVKIPIESRRTMEELKSIQSLQDDKNNRGLFASAETFKVVYCFGPILV